jgi:hypothetical protein
MLHLTSKSREKKSAKSRDVNQADKCNMQPPEDVPIAVGDINE